MPKTDCHLILLCFLATVFKSSLSYRRIMNGSPVTTDNPFMVYLLKASSSPTKYKGWTCGGVIIGDQYILTSAACVQDVEHMYAIAGYKKYVSDDYMTKDECIIKTRKKVILTCVPRGYNLDYNRTEVWSKEDIAVVKVESPYDFTDKTYEKICSYIPKPIEFNVERAFPKPGDDAIILGWGSSGKYRKDEDTVNYNSEMLQFASVKILEEDICVKYYSDSPAIQHLIHRSMLCTLEAGNLDDKGELIARTLPGRGCISSDQDGRYFKTRSVGKACAEEVPAELYDERAVVEDFEIKYDDGGDESIAFLKGIEMRRQNYDSAVEDDNNNNQDITSQRVSTKADKESPEQNISSSEGPHVQLEDQEERPGICQNDHGGPLITWRGGKVVVVAVATLFKENSKRDCRGPFLYTKTWCNGVFLNCILDQGKQNATRRNCDDPKTIGFEVVRRHISWLGHKDGPAENERIQIRHQVPISAFHP